MESHEKDGVTQKRPTFLSTYLPLLLTVLFWGSSFPAIKLVLSGFGPFSYIFFRFVGSSVFFALLLIHRRRRGPLQRKIGRSAHLKLALMALFEPGLYFLFETIGMQYTSASSASLIIASIPAMVALLAGFILKEHLVRREWVGVLLSVAGAFILAGFDDNAAYAESSLLGNGLVVLAAISAACYMIIARHLSANVSVLEVTSYQIFYGALYFFPVFLFRLPYTDWSRINPEAVGALLFLILCATLLAFLFYNTALSKIHASKAAVFLNGVPVVSVIVSALLLGEQLGPVQMAGGVVIIAGVTLTNIRRRRKPLTDNPPVR